MSVRKPQSRECPGVSISQRLSFALSHSNASSWTRESVNGGSLREIRGVFPGWTRMLSLLAELCICACMPAQLADLAVLCE